MKKTKIGHKKKINESFPKIVIGNKDKYRYIGKDGQYSVFIPQSNPDSIQLFLKSNDDGSFYAYGKHNNNDVVDEYEAYSFNMENVLDNVMKQLS